MSLGTEADLACDVPFRRSSAKKSEMVVREGDTRSVIGRLTNIRPPAHTISTNGAANGVFGQVNTLLEATGSSLTR
jgi:hypothetical protein